MADSDTPSPKRQPPKPLAMLIGYGACALIVGYVGWLLWSNFASSRNAREAQDASPTPQLPVSQNTASNPQPNSSAQQNGSPQANASVPLPSNGNTLSIQVASLQVTTRPDSFDDLLASPPAQATAAAHPPSAAQP